MKRLATPYLLLIIVTLGCSNPQKPREKQITKEPVVQEVIRISSPSQGSQFQEGELIQVQFSPISEGVAIDSVTLSIDGVRVGVTQGQSYTIPTQGLRLGNRIVRVTAWVQSQRHSASVGIQLRANTPPKILRYKVVNTYPHDIQAFTQGLFYHQGYLIESTGLHGASSLRRVQIETGKVIQSVNLDRAYFGEGTALHNGAIYQLTWTSMKGFVYDAQTFAVLRTFSYSTQGWGLTNFNGKLVMTDGSNIMYIMEPSSFNEVDRIEVYDDKGPVSKLNEIELIDGKIWANIFLTETVVIIDPNSGRVEAKVDFSGLLSESDRHVNIDVLNGIAWDEANRRLFVTGKNWPKLYHVEVF